MKVLGMGMVLIAIGALSFQKGHASGYTQECFEKNEPLPWDYCIHQPTDGSTGDVIYHLHGRGGSELGWMDDHFYTGQIRQIWSKEKQPLPVVISVSFGPFWLLAEKNQSPYSGMFELFTQAVIPTVESHLSSKIGRRVLLGESMGAFNSIQLGLKTRIFNKAAFLCAPMSELTPFASEELIEEYIKDKEAFIYYGRDTVYKAVKDMVKLSRIFFPTMDSWKQANPLLLAGETDLVLKNFYVAIGMYDKYASYEVNEIFVDRLERSGATVEWRPQWGGHCAIDIPSLADFLLRL